MGMGNIATTGMDAAMSNMDVISNNIANANTLGFKKSTASFADIFPSGNDASGVQIGLGVTLNSLQQNFKPGGFDDTGLPSDMCITGNGFFMLKDATSGQVTYSRDGHFQFDKATGYFSSGNQHLQGFAAVNGVIPAGGTPTDLQVSTAAQAANASTTVTARGLNLNSGDVVPTTAPFAATDPTSYNYTNQTTVYDSLGNATKFDLYYVKSAANNWNVYSAVNGTVVNSGSPGTLTFSSAGVLTSSTGLSSLGYTPTTGAAAMSIAVTMSGTTQYGNPDTTLPFATDGYAAGTFQNYQIDTNGLVTAIYSNGPPVVTGKVAIANFQSPQNLQNLGGATWAETNTSGAASINPTNSANNLKQGSLERSNVDLATELVNLINAQNVFQANAQVEQTYNAVMQTVTKL
ncbi:MAG: flagellar hook protein FlgE [Gammaproteobacteria bacterium]